MTPAGGVRAWLARGPVGRRLRPRALVLTYHRIADADPDPLHQAVRPDTFRRQLEHLAAVARVTDAPGVVRGHAEGRIDDGTVAITFDDGYADTLHAARPIAAALDVPLTVFVTTGPSLGDEGAFWWDELARAMCSHAPGDGAFERLHARLAAASQVERDRALQALPRADVDLGRPLRREELLRLARESGVSIGAHTVSHPRLSRLPEARQREELVLARAALAEAIGRPVDLLSYPFGKQDDVTAETRALAAAAGYTAAFSSIPDALHDRSDRYMLPRMSVHEWSAEEFAARVRHHLGGSSRP